MAAGNRSDIQYTHRSPEVCKPRLCVLISGSGIAIDDSDTRMDLQLESDIPKRMPNSYMGKNEPTGGFSSGSYAPTGYEV